MLNADRFLPVDDTLIPLGDPKPVKDTAMDFTTAKKIGLDMAKVEGGYDHCFILNKKSDELSLVGRATESTSGRVMEISTTQPAVQLYCGNFLDGSITTEGKSYEKHYGFLPRNATLSRFAEPARVSDDRPEAGRNVQAHDGLQVRRAEVVSAAQTLASLPSGAKHGRVRAVRSGPSG